MATLPTHARVVIVGGGIVGCSTAYHLAKAGWSDVVLLEQNQIAGGTTWHAAGMVTRLRSSRSQAMLNAQSATLYANLFTETGHDPQWRQVGSLLLARTPDRMTALRRSLALGRVFGVESHDASREDVKNLWPRIHVADLTGAFILPDDGYVEPAETARALAIGATKHGATLLEGVQVECIVANGRRITGVQTQDGTISAEIVVLCAGMWTRQLGQAIGCDLPLYPVQHHYAETEPVPGVHPDLPCTRDYDGNIYFRPVGDRIRYGAFQMGTKPWRVDQIPNDFSFKLLDDDLQTFSPAFDEFYHRFPALITGELTRFVNGPESFTPDGNCLLGPVAGKDQLYVAAGFNSFGIAGAGGAGAAIAAWIQTGEAPFDLREVDPRRFSSAMNEAAFLQKRTPEVLGHHYGIAWPHYQYRQGRDITLSPVHDRTTALGACFGQQFGWEQPLWYGRAGEHPRLLYSWHRPPWFQQWADEHRAAREEVALFDQSSIGKLQVAGPDALTLLNRMSGAEIDVPVGTVVSTSWFTNLGRLVSLVSVLRQGDSSFLVLAPTEQTRHNLDWLERHAARIKADVTLIDLSQEQAMLSVVGPRSRDLLQSICETDFSDQAFPAETMHPMRIDGHAVSVIRHARLGDLGWDILVPAHEATSVFDALVAVGARFNLKLAGTIAATSLQMEAGHIGWGPDVSADDSPVDSGLGSTLSWDKRTSFVGRDTLQQRASQRDRCLVTLILDDPSPMLWGGEPILLACETVGYTTSGSYGHTVGAAIARGYIPVSGDDNGASFSTAYSILIAGEAFTARAVLATNDLRARG